MVDIAVSLVVTAEKALTFLSGPQLLRLQWCVSANGKSLAQCRRTVKLKQSLAGIVRAAHGFRQCAPLAPWQNRLKACGRPLNVRHEVLIFFDEVSS
jgi:hypothetical protein